MTGERRQRIALDALLGKVVDSNDTPEEAEFRAKIVQEGSDIRTAGFAPYIPNEWPG